MSRRPLDPRRVNTLFDANTFDQAESDVQRLLTLAAAGKITLIAPGGVRAEALHPHTPAVVQAAVAEQIFALPTELNPIERRQLSAIRTILQGNAGLGKHAADAHHVFEAGKYGGGYFITHDRRINRTKLAELESVLPPSLWIVTLAEFLAIYDDFEAGGGT